PAKVASPRDSGRSGLAAGTGLHAPKQPSAGRAAQAGFNSLSNNELQDPKGERRNFMVEIDRGTRPVRRSDPEQTSFEGKMRVYQAAHAAREHQHKLGLANFRVLTITTDRQRVRAMMQTALHVRMNG